MNKKDFRAKNSDVEEEQEELLTDKEWDDFVKERMEEDDYLMRALSDFADKYFKEQDEQLDKKEKEEKEKEDKKNKDEE